MIDRTTEPLAAACDRALQLAVELTAAAETLRLAVDAARREAATAVLEREAVVTYTEAEAAALLKTSPRSLADRRRREHLPHCVTGRDVFYTAGHLRQIIAISEIKRSGNGRLRLA